LKGPRLRAVCVAAAALAGAIIYTVMTDGGRRTRASDPILPTVETAVAAVGFGLDQVAVTGQKYTPDADIFEALGLDGTRSYATFDTDAAKARIEELPWIEKAELVRVYPGGLNIAVTERKPWAVWHRGKSEFLIDRSGRVLAAVKSGSSNGLLRLIGEGAGKEAPALMAILARYPDVAVSLEEAERVAERRWTLKLRNNMTLILPPDREAQALAMYDGDRSVRTLTAAGGFTVDLRAVNKITLRKAPGSAPGTAAGTPADSQAKS
jgi:cell division protein FtsQ